MFPGGPAAVAQRNQYHGVRGRAAAGVVPQRRRADQPRPVPAVRRHRRVGPPAVAGPACRPAVPRDLMPASSPLSALYRLAPRRRLLVLGVLLLALIVAATAIVRACTGRAGTRSGYADQSRPGPVLLVPGYGGGRAALSVLAERIRATGRSASVLTLPGDGTGDLAQQPGTLDAAVTAALRAGSPSIDVVGYSAGGVVTLLWVVRYGGGHLARPALALGSPLHGARLAAARSAPVSDAR